MKVSLFLRLIVGNGTCELSRPVGSNMYVYCLRAGLFDKKMKTHTVLARCSLSFKSVCIKMILNF